MKSGLGQLLLLVTSAGRSWRIDMIELHEFWSCDFSWA